MDKFSNTQLEIETLPTVADIAFVPLSPDYLKVVRIQLVAGLAIPLLAIALLCLALPSADETADQGYSYLAWLLPALALTVAPCLFLLGIKEAKRKAWCIREHDIAFRYGLIFRKLIIQPLLRVQHVEVSQNPLEARWNLATLKLYSAGGFRYTFAIPGLQRAEAERIHEYVVNYQEAHHE